MKYKNLFCQILPAFLPFFFFSCENAEVKDKPITQISFEVTDSLVIDVLGNLELMDINSAQNRFLLYDNATNDIIVTDESGNILHRYSKEGDKPDSYGSFKISRATYINDSEYLMPGLKNIFHFHNDGTLIEKLPMDFESQMGMRIVSGRNIQAYNEQAIITMPGREIAQDAESRHQLELLDLSQKSFSPIIPYPQESKFGKEKNFEFMHTWPLYNFADGRLLLTFASEPKLYVYSDNDYSQPATAYALNPETFYEYPGEAQSNPPDEASRAEKFLYGSYREIASIGPYVYAWYNSGVAPQKAREIINSTEAWSDEFNEAIDAEMESYSQLFKNGKKIGADFKLPQHLSSMAKAFDEDNIWLSPNQTYEEKDYYVLYKARLILE